MTNVFSANDYGAGENKSPYENILAFQAAINDAHQQALATGDEQTVTATPGNYLWGAAVDPNATPIERYANQYRMRYGVNVPAPGLINLELEGVTWTLAVTPVPASSGLDNYTALVFGHLSVGVTPLPDMPIARRVSVRGLTIDASALTAQELSTLGEGSISGAVAFINCREFRCEGVTVPSGWGQYSGCLCGHAGSDDGVFIQNEVDFKRLGNVPVGIGILVDGGSIIHFVENTIRNAIHGIGFFTNHDNPSSLFPGEVRHPYAWTILGNRISDWHGTGVVAHASAGVIQRNDLVSIAGKYITITSSADQVVNGVVVKKGHASNGILIMDNLLKSTYSLGPAGFGVVLEGSAEVSGVNIYRNTYDNMFYPLHVTNPLAQPNIFWFNTRDPQGRKCYTEASLVDPNMRIILSDNQLTV